MKSIWSGVNRAERDAYATLRTVNDVKAVASGRIGRRIARRVYGKLSGRAARRWLG